MTYMECYNTNQNMIHGLFAHFLVVRSHEFYINLHSCVLSSMVQNYGYQLFFLDVGRSVCSDMKAAFLISKFCAQLRKNSNDIKL
jgi:hypothetical protein